ncbi:MAG: heme lyase CcmF/NrfE family subunit [Caldilineaceae bacterium]|nr:heme lyase CcmF/NrfE family subunit [Caldilineaceae bacterium]
MSAFGFDFVSLGSAALKLAIVLALYAVVIGPLGDRWKRPDWIMSARNALYVVTGLLLLASLALVYAFLTKDYSVFYVYQNMRNSQSLLYTWTAFWGGNAGSLLFWATSSGILATIAVTVNWRSQYRLMPYVISVLMTITLFFVLLLVFVADPFQRLDFTPPDGLGLNPLLRDPGMAIHPPLLLGGYMSMSIPYAFAMAALLTGRLDAGWIRATRRWTLTAWGVLSLGLLFGSWWAYRVLGWGGYWGWDPVENVALIPWLSASAYVHSVIVTEKRDMFKVWTMVLVILAFALSIFGTFIVRSGVITSVHSFAQSNIGPWFFSFLGMILILSFIALVYRLPKLESKRELDSLVSRESSFLFNNVLFLGIIFTTIVGVLFPMISELFQGIQITVGPPYYNQVNGPVLLMLMALMGIGPLLPWRSVTTKQLFMRFRWPVLVFVATVATLIAILGAGWPAVAFAVCAFTLTTLIQEFVQGIGARRTATGESWAVAAVRLVGRARRRYGGYFVHVGVILIAFGVIGSSFFNLEQGLTLTVGESKDVGRYTLTYTGLNFEVQPDREVVSADLFIMRNGKPWTELTPGKRFLEGFADQPVSNIGIRYGLVEDLYIVLTGWEEQSATFFVFVNPLVSWIWIGGFVLVLGGLIAWWPERAPKVAMAQAPRGVALRPQEVTSGL